MARTESCTAVTPDAIVVLTVVHGARRFPAEDV
jgi:hypothetical protein